MRNLTGSIEAQYESRILFSYKGKPGPDMISCIIHLAENKIELVESDKKIKRKLFRILVEILQNILHHEDYLDKSRFPSFAFYLVEESDHYLILSCNRLPGENAEKVESRIREFLKLSSAQKRSAYLEILGNGRFTSRGGAGLGLLDIIRNSEGNFNFDLMPSEFAEHKLLFLKIRVNKGWET